MSNGEFISIFERQSKTCSDCEHWSLYHREAPEGYIQSVCQEARDPRDYTVRRASDYCSKWKKRIPSPAF